MALSDFLNKISPYVTYNPVEALYNKAKGTRFDIPAQVSALGEIFNRGLQTATPTAYAQQITTPTTQPKTRDILSTGATTSNLGNIIGGDFGAAQGAVGASGATVNVEDIVKKLDAQADRAANELISMAAGNRDFAIRQLDAEHQVALGTGDVERAAFLEKVSDKLEQKIGTIAYDYERDIGRLEENKKTALERLAAAEKATRAEAEREAGRSREEQEVSLSQRGLLTAPRELAQGLATRDIGQLEEDINAKFEAFNRAVTEQRQDITRTAERGEQDITTTARRGAGAAQTAYTFGKEAAERQYEQARREAELERQRAKQLSAAYAIG